MHVANSWTQDFTIFCLARSLCVPVILKMVESIEVSDGDSGRDDIEHDHAGARILLVCSGRVSTPAERWAQMDRLSLKVVLLGEGECNTP